MAGNMKAEQARYTCPQCFTVHYRNDVLFAARRPGGPCDVRQAAHRRALSSADAFAQWCEAGETEIYLNWRTLPESRRRWKAGVITAVRDLDGRWLDRRVCPCCHMPLTAPFPVVFGWRGNGMSRETAFDLLNLAVRKDPAHFSISQAADTLPLKYDYLLNTSREKVLGVPAMPEHAGDSSYGISCLRRCCASAAGVIARLDIRLDADGVPDDTEAFQTLYALLKACGGSGIGLKTAAVFLLEGLNRPDAMEIFRGGCTQLFRHIQYDFQNSCFVPEPCTHPQEAVQAVKWLSGRVGRSGAEE